MDLSSLPPEVQAEFDRLQKENRELRDTVLKLLHDDFEIDKVDVLRLAKTQPTFREFLDQLERELL
jgi:hypothetical protein